MSAPARRPMPAAGPHVWAGPELSPDRFMLPVGAEEAPDETGTPGPALAAKLAQAAERCADGPGIALLRGLPPDVAQRLGPLAATLGTPAGAATAGAVPPCDLALVGVPRSGRAVLVSAGAVHNALLAQDAASVAALHAPQDGRPVFAAHAGVFAGLKPEAPPPALAAALADPALPLALDLRAGDLLLLDPFRVWALSLPEEASVLPVSTCARLSDPPFSRLIG
ncbi:MAG: hypothetical protein ACK4PG_14250 [Acetobacteraceae bacterium]